MRLNPTLVYLYSVVLSLVIVAGVLQIWRADPHVPLAYEWRDLKQGGDAIDPIGSNDAILFYGLFKGISENGWYLHNPDVGMPSGLNMHDYPMADSLHFFLIKALCYLTSDFFIATNIYFLVGFPLTALTTLFALREFKISDPLALVCSLLFTFLPYHFLRGEQHLFLASYFLVPLMLTVILWAINKESLFIFPSRGGWFPSNISTKGWWSLFICFLIGCGGVYYALFGVFFLAIGALIYQRGWKAVFPSFVFIGVIFMTLITNIIPTILFVVSHGRNLSVADHLKADGEIYGLKLIQMLNPVMHHRIVAFSDFSHYYYTHAPLVTENVTATLGFVGSAGFMALVFWQLGLRWRTKNDRLLTQLSTMNLAAVLLATVGGFSSVLCFGISPLVRCYNRMSVYIELFALLALALTLERQRPGAEKKNSSRVAWIICLVTLLGIGIFDQTTNFFIPPYEQSSASFNNDKNFVHRIESEVPAGSMIFQLPYIPFPEGRPGGLSLFRPYLHSRQLRWSYGSLPGREGDEWVRNVAFADGNLAGIVHRIVAKGFMGIYIDRALMPEHEQVEDELSKIVGAAPIVSENGRQAFFSFQKGIQ